MSIPQTLLQRIARLGLILMMGASMSACSESWKEEVLLHDGSKLIVERSQKRGGRHEIGQEVPVNWHRMIFTLPETNETVVWETKIGMNSDDSSLKPLALDVVKGVPYLITIPLICHNYNRWGRPNPPYVFLKFANKEWQRIPLEEFPAEIKEANLVNEFGLEEKKLIAHAGVVTADEIRKMNGAFKRDAMYQQVFVREPINTPDLAPDLGCDKFE